MFFALCIALLIAGAALIFYGVRRFLSAHRLFSAAAGWVSGVGEIVSASLDMKDSVGADQERLTTCRPAIQYRYTTPNGDHTGSRVWLNRETFADQTAAQKWLAAHPTGGQVVVHFNPAQPDMATLVIDKPSVVTAIVSAGLGVILGVTALSLLLEG